MLNVGDEDVGQHRAREHEGKELYALHQQQHGEPVVGAPQRDAERFELVPRGEDVQRQIGRKERNPGQPEPGSVKVRRAFRPGEPQRFLSVAQCLSFLTRSEACLRVCVQLRPASTHPIAGGADGIIA